VGTLPYALSCRPSQVSSATIDSVIDDCLMQNERVEEQWRSALVQVQTIFRKDNVVAVRQSQALHIG